MLNTVGAIAHLLKGTCLDGSAIQQVPIDASDQDAFVIEVEQRMALDAWAVLRSLLEQTKRYPILTESWGCSDYFSRFYYDEEHQAGMIAGVSPEAIIASIPMASMESFLANRKADGAPYLQDSVDDALQLTEEKLGRSPSLAEVQPLIDQQLICNRYDLEKWLFNWELQHVGLDGAIASVDTHYLDWFQPGRPTAPLILLPTDVSWNALAYLHWFGASTVGTPIVMRFLQRWHQQYAAELVCHYGTMLQFNIGRRPSTPNEAFELAWQQEVLAECTTILPGVSLRDHAWSLLVLDRWFLHERP